MTLKRKLAHRSGEGTSADWFDIALRISSPVLRRCRGCKPAGLNGVIGILCGRTNGPRLTGIGAGRGGRDRREKAQQIQEAIPAFGREDFTQRPRQCRFVEGRHEAGSRPFPKGAPGKCVQSEIPPPLQRASIGTGDFAQAPHPIRTQPVAQGGQEQDNETRIDPAAHEAHRGRSRTLPASLLIATEAEAAIPRGPLRQAAWFAPDPGRMQPARTAMGASLHPDLLRQILVDFLQESG